MANASAIAPQRQNLSLEPERVPLRMWIGVAIANLSTGILDYEYLSIDRAIERL